jgi:hypothetical protein
MVARNQAAAAAAAAPGAAAEPPIVGTPAAARRRIRDAATPDPDPTPPAQRGGNRKKLRDLWDPVPGEDAYGGPEWLLCKGDCGDLTCMKSLTIRSFPERAVTSGGYCMYTVWLIRHFFPPGDDSHTAYDCGDKESNCRGSLATIMRNKNTTFIRCNKPCSIVHRLGAISPFFRACGKIPVHRVMAYVFCFMSGASVRFSRHVSGLSNNASVTQLNNAISQICVTENAREFLEIDKDNWEEIQADESAAGKRKYHRGRRVRKGGIVWMAGAAKIHRGRVERIIARVVTRRRTEDLVPTLVELVRHDGILTTDCWRAYGSFGAEAMRKAEGALRALTKSRSTSPLQEELPPPPQAAAAAAAAAAAPAAAAAAPVAAKAETRHRTVNHKKNFKDPVTGAHSNHIEGMWAVLKNELRRRFGRVGFSDMEIMNSRVQLGVWLCNTRLAYLRDQNNGLHTTRAFFRAIFRHVKLPDQPERDDAEDDDDSFSDDDLIPELLRDFGDEEGVAEPDPELEEFTGAGADDDDVNDEDGDDD